jgi:hypothetical protein
MEGNPVLVALLVALQTLTALRDMVIKMSQSGSRERNIKWNVQLAPLTEGTLLVRAFC